MPGRRPGSRRRPWQPTGSTRSPAGSTCPPAPRPARTRGRCRPTPCCGPPWPRISAPTRRLRPVTCTWRSCSRDPAPPPGGPARPAVPGTQIVGRERELAELTAAWERAAAGTPSLALIVGEAGIGKTRLAQVLAGSLESAGATVLQARCYETERSLFLQPVVEAVLPAVARTPAAVLHGLLGEDAATFAALIPEAAAILGPLPTGHLPARL